MIGPLTSGVKSVAVKSASITSQACDVSGSTQSGTANARIPNAASLRGATRRTTKTAQTVPTSVPAPSAAKNRPAIRELSNCSYAKNASDADRAVTTKPKPATVAVSGPISPSRTTNRSPASRPRCAGARRGLRFGTSVRTIRNETRNVAAST